MTFDPYVSAIRFGTGLSPVIQMPVSVTDQLAMLAGPDLAARTWPIPDYDSVEPSLLELYDLGHAARAARGTADEAAMKAAYDAMRLQARAVRQQDLAAVIARAVTTQDGFRERLVHFWADHFTVRSKIGFSHHLVTPFVESAIRPHVTGRFADMLIAVTTHPEMLRYLDQIRSMGPNSERALRQDRGLNENLARELLELHTIGVNGPYSQTDVREMAELLTGLGWTPADGMRYRPDFAEPGAETVLGVTYSSEASLSTVIDALEGLARHPATAAHIATKLAAHFVADTPDPDLVAALTFRFLDTGGDLLAMSETLLSHPAAQLPLKAKVKTPFQFISSSLRALGVTGDTVTALETGQLRRWILGPLTIMGQPWEEPAGPDGWPEAAEAWVTPQGVAGRINWSMRAPRAFVEEVPDPRDFVRIALGPHAQESVVFAASAAEGLNEGVGIVLASADFQRR